MLNRQRLLTPGPTPLPERVRLAMARDMIHHRKSAFRDLMAEARPGLAALFGTQEPVLPLAASGTGAMVAAVANLFAPGEKVLVIEGGKFGERWTSICRTHGLVPEVLRVAWGKAVDPADVALALDKDPAISGVLVQHSETSTGVQHPVDALAALTRTRPVLLVVDGISAVSITPCPMDAWGIDCLLTGSQKGLMLPPGLALIALSARAWDKAAGITPNCFYFNLRKERESNAKGQTAFTSPVSLIVGLVESLRLFAENGLDAIHDKQWALTRMARKGLEAMGLTLFAQDNYAWGVTSVLLPQGIDAVRLVAHAAERHGVIMATGQDAYKNSMVRLGHMGWVDYGDLTAGLHAFAASYTAQGGHIGCRNYLEQALAAYWTALDEGCPKRI